MASLSLENQIASQAVQSAVFFKSGPWTDEEQHLFLEALKIYGKDWESIQKHVGTREMNNLRSHGQKFLRSLTRLLEGKQSRLKMERSEAKLYFEILNKKINKYTNMDEERQRAQTMARQKSPSPQRLIVRLQFDDLTSKQAAEYLHSSLNQKRSLSRDRPSRSGWPSAKKGIVSSRTNSNDRAHDGRIVLNLSSSSSDNGGQVPYQLMIPAEVLGQISLPTMSDMMSELSLDSTTNSSLSWHSDFLLSQVHNMQHVKIQYEMVFEGNPHFKKLFHQKVDEIEEYMNRDSVDLHPEVWKTMCTMDFGGNIKVDFFEEVNKETYLAMTSIIFKKGFSFRNLNLYKVIMKFISERAGIDLIPDLQRMSIETFGRSYEEVLEYSEQLAKEKTLEWSMNAATPAENNDNNEHMQSHFT